jgi:hypothetical protein
MSWASTRKTTRVEDQAYSLMGLFGIHMPTLYGEGKNAFTRLQIEIINSTDDDSIFAFNHGGDLCRMLATSPEEFYASWSVVRNIWDPDRPAHTMSSKGLCVHFQLILEGEVSFAPLNCTRKDNDGAINRGSVVGFKVHKQLGSDTWLRDGMLETIDINGPTLAKEQRTMLYAERNETTDDHVLRMHGVKISIGSLS